MRYIRRRNMKTLRVRVEDDGEVLISGPGPMSEKKLEETVEKYRDVIEDLKRKAKENPKKYRDRPSEDIYYLYGKPFKVKRTSDGTGILRDIPVKISSEGPTTEELKDIHRIALESFVEEIRRECYDLTGCREKILSFYQYKRRYGTCFPGRGEIRLAYALARRSKEEIRLVYLHELMHMRHPNHSKEFYRDLRRIVKDYDRIERLLKE